jgi:hypothetical protein
MVMASRRISALSSSLPSEATRASATSAAANAALEALEEGLQDWYRRRAVRDAATTLGPLRLLELSGDALRQAMHVELLWACLVVGLSGPITIAHRAYGYHLGFAEGATAGVIIASVGVALQMARPLADGGLPGQQARWEAAVSRAAAEEESRIAEVEAQMEDDAREHGVSTLAQSSALLCDTFTKCIPALDGSSLTDLLVMTGPRGLGLERV